MKKLNLLDQSTSFKVNDTGTIIPFNAYEDNQPVFVTSGDMATFRIKNEMGFLKAVNATVATGGYIFELNTKDLVGLVPGTYEIELSITNNKDNEESIFPDTGFCSFTINESALTVTGTQIPTMSLDSFKQQLEQYVQAQTATKIQGIEDDFKTYVASVKEGPQGEAGPAGNDGKAATITVGATTTADVGESANVTNSGTDNNAVLNFTIPRGEQGPKGDTGASSTVNVGKVNSYTARVAYDSTNDTYFKGYLGSNGSENANNSDIVSGFWRAYENNMYTIQIPANIPPFSNGNCRIVWYDQQKTVLSSSAINQITPPYAWTVTAPANAYYARVSCYVGQNGSTTGANVHIVVSDIGHNAISNGGTDTNVVLNFDQLSGGPAGVPGIQGAVGPTGPAGGFGSYVTGTGWLDLLPYCNKDVVVGWSSDNLGYCRYAVNQINGQNIFWFRMHSRVKDASIFANFGTKLFDIPQAVLDQYGAGEWNQYNTMLECGGVPCMMAVVKSGNSASVQTNGYLPLSVGGKTSSLPSGTQTFNFEGWYVL